MNETINLLVVLVLTGIVVLGALALGNGFIALRRRTTTATPGLTMIYEALEPLAIEAIYGAERFALKFYDATRQKLTSTNKKALADNAYGLLPDAIWVAGRRIPVGVIKALVPREAWESFVQQVFDQAEAKLTSNEAWLTKGIAGVAERVDLADGVREYTGQPPAPSG